MKPTPFEDNYVEDIFLEYPDTIKQRLLELRELIFSTAASLNLELLETTKWGQPSYLTHKKNTGTTIRIDRIKSNNEEYAIFVHCQTSLIGQYKTLFGSSLRFDGKRGIIFNAKEPLPAKEIATCIEMALTYHINK